MPPEKLFEMEHEWRERPKFSLEGFDILGDLAKKSAAF